MSGGEDLTQVNVNSRTRFIFLTEIVFVPFDPFNESSCFAATLSYLVP